MANVPVYIIRETAKAEMNYKFTSDGYIHKILRNEIYSAQQYVKPYNNQLGGIFKAAHEPIIDLMTWHNVQNKINEKNRPRISLSDEIPLRGVLHCHCGKLLTGAPSKNKIGNYYYYYKCNHSKHNNISAIKAHTQLEEVLNYLSLPTKIITAIEQQSHQLLEERLSNNKKQLKRLKFDFEKVEQQLHNIEEKWVNNQFSFDTYQKWNSSLTQEKSLLGAKIDTLSKDENRVFYLLKQNLVKLTDMNANYKTLDTLGKQEMIKTVFDNKLYYENKIYRTPYIMPIFTHNLLIIKQKQLLLIDKKGDFENKISLGGAEESRTPVQTQSP